MQLELEKGLRGELGHTNEHAARRPQPQVGAGDGLEVAFPGDAAFLDRPANAEGAQFGRADGLQTGSGDREDGQSVGLFGRLHCTDTNAMTKHIILFALLSASIAGCAKDTPTEASQTRSRREHDRQQGGSRRGRRNRGARHPLRRAPGRPLFRLHATPSLQQQLRGALTPTSGTLSAAANDALFNTVFAQSPFDFKDDYGTSRGAADMMEYTIRITIGGDAIKTIRADDGTMPEPLRRIVSAVLETVSAARK